MNDTDLHKTLTSLATAKIAMPLNQQQIKQRLLQRKTKQTLQHFSLGAFLKNLKKGFTMKSSNKQRIAFSPMAIAIAALILTGTVGATAYWFKTTVLSSQHGDEVDITVKDCSTRPFSELKAVGLPLQGPSTFNLKYKIVDPSYITEQQIATARIAECEQLAIAGLINKHFPDMQEFSAANLATNSRGLYFPLYKTGTVVGVTSNNITIGDLNPLNKPELASTQTIHLSNDVLALDGDAPITVDTLKPGDQVYFAYQNQKVAGEEPDLSDIKTLRRLSEINERSVIRGIGKLQIDYHAWDKLLKAISDKAVEVVEEEPSKG